MKSKYYIYIVCLLIIFSIVISVVLLSNSKEKKYRFGDEIKLYISEEVEVEDLKISLISISDSTCKMDVQCIWQGEYSYKLTVNDEELILGTVTAREKTYKNYRISLTENSTDKYIQFKVNKVK